MSLDSVAVFIRLDRSELLYLRETPTAPFTSEVQVLMGNQRWSHRDTVNETTPKLLDAVWRIAIRDLDSTVFRGAQIDVNYSVRDTYRNAETQGTWSVPPAHQTIHQFDASGWAKSGQDAEIGDTLYFEGPGGMAWIWSIATPEIQLPSPPFTASSDPLKDLKSRTIDTLFADETGRFALVVPPGTSTLSSMALDFQLIVHGRRHGFPMLRKIPDMIESTRYITSRSEYERMMASDDPKGALDQFWLNCGNDKDRGSNLIATYYGRVEEANRYFSGLQEGWRTDRGMVHVVFGVPNKVRKSGRSEWWIYGEEGNANSLTFSFRYAPTDLDQNRYILDRSIQFRPAWDRMVTNWRNGRIQED